LVHSVDYTDKNLS